MCQEVKVGEFYRHFKGNVYQIREIAKDCETQKKLVVYQGMYPPYTCWVRSYEDFICEVNREKYPDVAQQYRFEKIEKIDSDFCEKNESLTMSEEQIQNIFLEGMASKYLEGSISNEEIGRMGMMQLLDANSFHDKKEIFKGLKKYLTKNQLANISVALDIVLEDGSIEEQFDSVLYCLNTLEHYEGGRLR